MSWFLLLSTLFLLWLWWDWLGAKEIARATCQKLCREHEVIFLDDTVVLSRLRLRRDGNGNFRLFRCFTFEFTADNEHRYQGQLEMYGHFVTRTQMEPYRIH